MKELVRLSNEQIDAVITEVRHGHAFRTRHGPASTADTTRAACRIHTLLLQARRAAGSKLKNASVEAGDPAAVVYELLVDNANGRKRLNDYTEGLLVQTAHKMDALRREWQSKEVYTYLSYGKSAYALLYKPIRRAEPLGLRAMSTPLTMTTGASRAASSAAMWAGVRSGGCCAAGPTGAWS